MAWLIRVSHAEGELVLRDVPGLSTVAELKESVVAELGLPPAEHHAMRLCRRGRDLQDACVVDDELGGAVSREVHLSVLWRLVGGKGGTLLRDPTGCGNRECRAGLMCSFMCGPRRHHLG